MTTVAETFTRAPRVNTWPSRTTPGHLEDLVIGRAGKPDRRGVNCVVARCPKMGHGLGATGMRRGGAPGEMISAYESEIDGVAVETLTISPKFQVVIPKTIRESLGLSPGQKVQAVLYGNGIELIPLQPAKRLGGFLKGVDTTVPREPDRA